MISLVLGGARSGKSRYAEGLCVGERHYIATAQAFDDEMRERIAKHKLDRGGGWITHEEPFELLDAIRAADAPGRSVLVDCLTLWLTNMMLAERDWKTAAAEIMNYQPMGQVVFVSNEVGLGIVPENALARAFRDAQGVLNQQIAARAERVVFMVAGLPMVMK
jgi:adenosylcobinamide kinase / adenosylcobinamide-phosphate guanylyltransferase